MADEITIMATYSITPAFIAHYMEIYRCTREHAIRGIIKILEPSTIREMMYDDDGLDYEDGLNHCDCGVC